MIGGKRRLSCSDGEPSSPKTRRCFQENNTIPHSSQPCVPYITEQAKIIQTELQQNSNGRMFSDGAHQMEQQSTQPLHGGSSEVQLLPADNNNTVDPMDCQGYGAFTLHADSCHGQPVLDQQSADVANIAKHTVMLRLQSLPTHTCLRCLSGEPGHISHIVS